MLFRENNKKSLIFIKNTCCFVKIILMSCPKLYGQYKKDLNGKKLRF